MASAKIILCALTIVLCFSQACLAVKDTTWQTGYAYDPRCSTYIQSYGHPEAPQRVTWIDSRLHDQELFPQLTEIKPLKNPMPHIRRVHDSAHVAGIHSIAQDDSATEKIGPIADLAAALALGAVKDVCEGKVKNAFCNIRPPGHHVTNGGYTSGFCAYANVVIAARYAQEVHNHKRVLICDWDYHHGNSTVFFFCNDTNAMFFEVGCDGCGAGCNDTVEHIITKNPGYSYNSDEYVSVWTEYLIPAARIFKPDIVLISCGFDIKQNDALGSFSVTARGISTLTKIAMDIAEEHCDGKLVSVLEGGYYDSESGGGLVSERTWYGISQCAENHVRTLMTGQVQPETEYFDSLATYAEHSVPAYRIESLLYQPKVHYHLSPHKDALSGNRVFDIRGRKITLPKKEKKRQSDGVLLVK